MTQKLIDLSFSNNLPPRKGRILLSDPFLGDEYFERSVVYLCEHSKEGSFGFVLNNYIDIQLTQLNEKFPEMMVKLSIGGPVEKETMYFMHTLGEQLKDSLLIDQNIYMGGDFEQLYKEVSLELLSQNKVRFFIGYSGWSAGQLQNEIKEHAWIVANVDNVAELMDVTIPDLWKHFMNKLGKKYQIMSDFPIDPSEN
jgi:putative transcriptional regulator